MVYNNTVWPGTFPFINHMYSISPKPFLIQRGNIWPQNHLYLLNDVREERRFLSLWPTLTSHPYSLALTPHSFSLIYAPYFLLLITYTSHPALHYSPLPHPHLYLHISTSPYLPPITPTPHACPSLPAPHSLHLTPCTSLPYLTGAPPHCSTSLI